MIETDSITILDNELPNTYHVFSKKIGELGIIFKPDDKGVYVFKPFESHRYLKAWHLSNIIKEINILNNKDRD